MSWEKLYLGRILRASIRGDKEGKMNKNAAGAALENDDQDKSNVDESDASKGARRVPRDPAKTQKTSPS